MFTLNPELTQNEMQMSEFTVQGLMRDVSFLSVNMLSIPH